jgi:hypothetical protein
MAENRPWGIGSDPFLTEWGETENPRRVSLDPRVMRGHGSADRPDTPVGGIDYSTIRKLKTKFDTGAKIVHVIKRVIELVTSAHVDDSQLVEIVDIILRSEVTMAQYSLRR